MSLLKRATLYLFLGIVIMVAGIVVYYLTTLYRSGPAQKGYLALTGGTVLVEEGLEPLKEATILILDGVIVEVGPARSVEIPTDATILDATGHTVIPGLMDLHVHLASPALERGEQPGPLQMLGQVMEVMRFVPHKRRALLNHGVTTVRDLGSEYQWIIDFRRLINDGELEGPRLFVAGPIFTTAEGHPVVTIGVEPQSDSVRLPSTVDEAREAVRQLAADEGHVDVIKIVQERGSSERPLQPIAPDVLQAIVDEAHDLGLPVTAHWGTPEDLEDVLRAGVDELQHLEPRGVEDGWPQEHLNLLLEQDVPLSPTLAVTDVVLPAAVNGMLRRLVAEFGAAGGRLVVGSDAGMPGVPFGAGVHRELELLVESGLTPREALQAATGEAARVLQREDIGAIMPGRAADLVVVAGDPLQDIRALEDIVLVLRDGRLVVDHRNQGEAP